MCCLESLRANKGGIPAKDCVYSWLSSVSHNTPEGELILRSWSVSDVPSFVLSELGSNPLNSAGIDEGAFADLKKVSYIRIADTNITEIPKGTAPNFLGKWILNLASWPVNLPFMLK